MASLAAQDDETPEPPTDSMRLPLRLCLGFGVGSFGISVLLNTVTTFFPALMTTVLGQSAAFAGLLLTISKLYDAFADIAIGALSDRTHSRWGRRRPYLLAGTIVSALSFLLIFAPPMLASAGLIVWMALALIVYSTGYSLFSVPYMAMAGEMTDGYHERTRLLSYRAFFISFGQIVSSAGTAALIQHWGGGRLGYGVMGATTGIILALSMALSFLGTARARGMPVAPARPGFTGSEAIRTLLSNRPLVLLMAIKLSQYMAIAIINTSKLLFLLNVVGIGYTGLINLTLVQNLVSAGCLPLWVTLARRIGKRPAYLLATGLLAMVYLSWFWTGPGMTMPAIWLRGALNGVAAAGTTLMSIAMLPDVMEYDRLRTGVRREGIFSSVYSIVEKLGYSLGAGLSGVILALAGYIPTLGGKLVVQPPHAIAGLYAGASLIPAALMTLSFIVMLAYPLDEAMLRATKRLAG